MCLLFITDLSAQESFEGKLTFHFKYTSKKPGISADMLRKNFGDSSVVYIKEGNYRQTYFNAIFVTDVYYDPVTNRYYYRRTGIDTIYYKDCSIELNKIDSIFTADSPVNILGFNCKVLKMKSSNSIVFYYFAPELYMDPKFYEQHKLGGYDIFARESKSLYLKVIREYSAYNYVFTATSIKREKLSPDIFKLPSLPVKEK